ncbi:MAG: hypothetical protein AAGI38_21925 [Bacteroidota bacterium]
MTPLKRNLWVLITLSAFGVLATNWFIKSNCTSYACSNWAKASCSVESLAVKTPENPLVMSLEAPASLPIPLNKEAVSANVFRHLPQNDLGIDVVVAKFWVDEKGRAFKIELLSPSSMSVDAPLDLPLLQLTELEFKPARHNDQNVSGATEVSFYRFEGLD